ncbi:MAG: glycosyl hydrolase repeat-containing protein [Gemmatimonadetes bacterium]|nr:glycosyl hydrolase repeat-containing protein [Gemmatimonadota bacterium]
MHSLRPSLVLVALGLLAAPRLHAQQVDPRAYSEMRWRMIGPFRASRTKAAVGIPEQPNVFYIGAVDGGVWKTTDYGRTWNPIFDDQPSGSIGAIAIAPSNANVIYVGSGEGLQRPDLSTGDGIYKSTDAGKSWTHLGLRDGQQIPQIVVDPRDPNRLFVAVMGHPYGPNAERGLFRSTDGGASFQKVLFKDENTGAIDVVMDPADPKTIYCVLWEARQGPWENGQFSGPGSGLFKSIDGGDTWRKVGKGLPTFEQDGLGRIGITVAPSMPSRMFATVGATRNLGLYRSDDAGENWYKSTPDDRVSSRESDFAEVKVDPKNADIVYTASVVTWKSIDGGKTFKALRGAPGGDDYHRIWINPLNPNIILIASDQGAIVSVNDGETWSSWYNQPTAAFYHVITDNAFPYRVCSGQQESGSACVRSRGDDGRIMAWDWHPAGVEEYGYAAPDPLDPEIVYGGKVSRYDRRTGDIQQVGPRVGRGGGADYRTLRTAPLVFSTVDPHALFFASNVVWKTTTGGKSWTQISSDLTRTDSVVPPNVGTYSTQPAATARHGGVIYTVAPSYVNINRIWAGTDDGLIHTTADGGAHWTDVTPADLRARPWSKISIMDAGRFDAGTAYAAVNTLRLDDLNPHVYRTHDGGTSWKQIVAGLPAGAVINVVREDPKRRGLLYAGSETQVWVSFDDGDHWSSLRLNLPATSIRDLVIKDDDIVVGTHGRSFWILDDVAPLRQLTASTASGGTTLFKPAAAYRFRWSKYPDTPFPPDEPSGQNPPDGAILDYFVAANASGDAKLEIVEANGRVIRTYSSRDTSMAPADLGNTPSYWIRPTQVLSAAPGFHRFVWDVHYAPPAGTSSQPGQYPISATPYDTPREPRGPWALPGQYMVRLTVGTQSLTQPLTIKMDPRVKTPSAALAQAHVLSVSLYDAIARDSAITAQVRALRNQLRDASRRANNSSVTESIDTYDAALVALAGQGGGGRRGGGGGRGRGGAGAQPSFASINGDLSTLLALLEEADAEPTTQAVAAARATQRDFDALVGRWNTLRTTDLAALNAKLRAAGLQAVSLVP